MRSTRAAARPRRPTASTRASEHPGGLACNRFAVVLARCSDLDEGQSRACAALRWLSSREHEHAEAQAALRTPRRASARPTRPLIGPPRRGPRRRARRERAAWRTTTPTTARRSATSPVRLVVAGSGVHRHAESKAARPFVRPRQRGRRSWPSRTAALRVALPAGRRDDRLQAAATVDDACATARRCTTPGRRRLVLCLRPPVRGRWRCPHRMISTAASWLWGCGFARAVLWLAARRERSWQVGAGATMTARPPRRCSVGGGRHRLRCQHRWRSAISRGCRRRCRGLVPCGPPRRGRGCRSVGRPPT